MMVMVMMMTNDDPCDGRLEGGGACLQDELEAEGEEEDHEDEARAPGRVEGHHGDGQGERQAPQEDGQLEPTELGLVAVVQVAQPARMRAVGGGGYTSTNQGRRLSFGM